jgi:wyosine [tRNA(Phe)-imidazoG37] synthetase (radical SAM superfamily)
MGEDMSTYVYGPVPSRRLGRSLGIDLVPLKTCTYDCLYCQLGKTTHKTIKRQEWAPPEVVLTQLKTQLASEPDIITISGSGEPTLHEGIGSLIKAIKAMTSIPVAILTNSSLLWLPEVRDALCSADVVIPSLDAGNEHLFRLVNRPYRDITFHRMINGLYEFRQAFSGQFWLEVLLLGGITGLPHPVEQIREIAGWIVPDRIHLNTVVRPPSHSSAFPVPRGLMERFAESFGDKAEVIGSGRKLRRKNSPKSTPQDVLALVSRRPCTLEDIAAGLGLAAREAARYVNELSNAGLLAGEYQGKRLFFRASCDRRRRPS